VLYISQVYPARLKILNHGSCRVIFDFRAEQYKFELYQTLLVLFYLSCILNGWNRYLSYKTDYFPYFNITNSMVDHAFSFRHYGFFLQIASNRPHNHCFNQKHHRDISFYIFWIPQINIQITFCLKKKSLKYLNCPTLSAILILRWCLDGENVKHYFFEILQCSIIELTGIHGYYLNMFKEYFNIKQVRQKSQWKTGYKIIHGTIGRWPNELRERGLFNTRRIKQSLLWYP